MDINQVTKFFKENSIIIVLISVYLLLTLPFLSSSPLVWYDEGLVSEPAWHFANGEFFRQPLWTGYFNYENFSTHPNYGYFFILAVFFKLLGLGIIQARMVSVIAGLLLLTFVYYFTKKFFTQKIANIAVLFLVVNPLFILSARMARQEMTLALFSVFAFLLIMFGNKKNKNCYGYFWVSGIVSAYAILVHLNGIFITLALWCVILTFNQWKYLLYFILGVCVGIIPYIIFLLLHWQVFSIQFFGLWSYRLPGQENIVTNIMMEPLRWINGITTPFSIAVGIFAFIYLFTRIRKWKQIYLMIIILMISFACFDYHKYYGYLLLLLPFLSILFAIMMSEIFNKKRVRQIAFFFFVLFLFFNIVFIEFKIIRDSNHNYQEYCKSVINAVDNHAILLADPSLFFCFHEGNLRDFIVQIWIKDQREVTYNTLFHEVNITYIIFDPILQDVIEKNEGIFKTDTSYYETIRMCEKIKELPAYSIMNNGKTEIYMCHEDGEE